MSATTGAALPNLLCFIGSWFFTADAVLANAGTFIGALCFLVAALLVLPRDGRIERGDRFGA